MALYVEDKIRDLEDENAQLRTDLAKTSQERDLAEREATARSQLVKDAEATKQDMRTQWLTIQGALASSDENWQREIERRKAARADALRDAADWFDNANLSPEADQLRRMADAAERGESA